MISITKRYTEEELVLVKNYESIYDALLESKIPKIFWHIFNTKRKIEMLDEFIKNLVKELLSKLNSGAYPPINISVPADQLLILKQFGELAVENKEFNEKYFQDEIPQGFFIRVLEEQTSDNEVICELYFDLTRAYFTYAYDKVREWAPNYTVGEDEPENT